MKVSNLSEQSPLGAGLAVFGALGTVLAVGALVWKDTDILLGLTAGAGWTLAAVVVYLNGAKARQIKALQAELGDARAQISELVGMSSNVARAVNTVLDMRNFADEAPPPRRTPPRQAAAEPAPLPDPAPDEGPQGAVE